MSLLEGERRSESWAATAREEPEPKELWVLGSTIAKARMCGRVRLLPHAPWESKKAKEIAGTSACSAPRPQSCPDMPRYILRSPSE